METTDGAARLERTAGRAGPRPSPPTRRRARPPRRRRGPVAAAVLVGALAVAWLVIGRNSSRAAEGPPPVGAGVTVPTIDLIPLEAVLGDPRDCADASVSAPELRCTVDGVRVEARLVDPGDVETVYTTATGANVVARAGSPVCEQGGPDERSWSRAAQPKRAVGRYLCRFEQGKAAMWWYEERGLVAHAVASDHDLAALFAWWRAHLDGAK